MLAVWEYVLKNPFGVKWWKTFPSPYLLNQVAVCTKEIKFVFTNVALNEEISYKWVYETQAEGEEFNTKVIIKS